MSPIAFKPKASGVGHFCMLLHSEALQIVIEAILSHLDLASLCLGTPTLDHGFIDIDMQTLVTTAGIGQRRIERAVALLKEAGFLEVTQPRTQNEQGDYCGCRAIRVVRAAFFEWLDLGPMLETERRKASARLQRRAQRANRKLSDLISYPPLLSFPDFFTRCTIALPHLGQALPVALADAASSVSSRVWSLTVSCLSVYNSVIL